MYQGVPNFRVGSKKLLMLASTITSKIVETENRDWLDLNLFSGNLEGLKLLLIQGADVNAKTKSQSYTGTPKLNAMFFCSFFHKIGI